MSRASLDGPHEVAIIGAGQAGLSMSYLLKQAGVQHVLLERERAGHAWRAERWDSFCLVTPNWQCQLPGHPYRGPDPQGFMVKQEIVEYLERYVTAFEPPLMEGVSVQRVCRARSPSARFELQTSAGPAQADQVVVATGGYHDPLVPACAARISEEVLQLHSRDYTSPSALAEGAVLVVGSGQSGCQIAEDLLLAGRRVHLAVGNAPRCARRYRGKDVVEWLHLMGHYELPVDQHPSKEQVRDKTNHYVTGRDGGRDIDLRELAQRGLALYGSLRDADGTHVTFAPDLKLNLDAADAVYNSINRSIDTFIERRSLAAPPASEYRPSWSPAADPLALDLAEAGVRSIIWAIGFRPNFRWLDFPIFDAKGLPHHVRGVTAEQGLYFLGLPWQHTWGSGRFSGVGRDAEHLARHISSLRESGRERAAGARARAAGRHT